MALLSFLIEDPVGQDLRKLEVQTGSLNQALGEIRVSFARLDERIDHRTSTLESTVAAAQGQITTLKDSVNHLPSRTLFYTVACSLAALFVAISFGLSVAYWNGVGGRIEAVKARLDTVNLKIDTLTRGVDTLSKTVDALPRVSPSPPSSKRTLNFRQPH